MSKQKHLDLSQRITIEYLLKENKSFKAIGRELGKDCTTISKEIKNHRIFKQTGALGRPFNNCVLRYQCDARHLCQHCRTNRYCKFCKNCHINCKDYKVQHCTLPLKAPYVCNGCDNKNSCTLEKVFYSASAAQKEYEYHRSESRMGISMSETNLLKNQHKNDLLKI